MSTNSSISIEKKDGKISTIYCHNDGYLKHNGIKLYMYWDTVQKINKLMRRGDMSILDKDVLPISKKNNFLKPIDGYCLFYRDRDEKCPAKEYLNMELFLNYYSCQEFNYIFKDNSWFIIKNKKFIPLEQEIIVELQKTKKQNPNMDIPLEWYACEQKIIENTAEYKLKEKLNNELKSSQLKKKIKI